MLLSIEKIYLSWERIANNYFQPKLQKEKKKTIGNRSVKTTAIVHYLGRQNVVKINIKVEVTYEPGKM